MRELGQDGNQKKSQPPLPSLGWTLFITNITQWITHGLRSYPILWLKFSTGGHSHAISLYILSWCTDVLLTEVKIDSDELQIYFMNYSLPFFTITLWIFFKLEKNIINHLKKEIIFLKTNWFYFILFITMNTKLNEKYDSNQKRNTKLIGQLTRKKH